MEFLGTNSDSCGQTGNWGQLRTIANTSNIENSAFKLNSVTAENGEPATIVLLAKKCQVFKRSFMNIQFTSSS